MNEANGSRPFLKAGDPVTLKELDQAHIRYWLEEKGCIKDAAPIIGMHPGSLARKIQKEKIPWTKNASHPGAGVRSSDDDETLPDD